MKGVGDMTLKEIYTKYKKYIVLVVGAIVIFYVATWFFRAIDLKDGYSVLAGEYKNAAARDKAESKRLTADNLKLAKDIVAQDEKIVRLESDIKAKTQNISHLTNAISGLNADLASAQTDRERVVILTTLVDNYVEKCTIYDGIIADKDTIIAGLEAKFADQQKITENYRVMLDAAVDRENILKDMNKKLSNQLKVARLGGKVKTGLVLTALAVVAYGELKK